MREIFTAIQEEIREFIAQPDDRFDDLARHLFRFQFGANAPYRSYCEALGSDPSTVASWDQIPPVPTSAFKTDQPLSCLPPGDCGRIFLTSGTRRERRGRHYLADTSLYQSAVLAGWQHAGLPRALRRLFLARDPAATPDSSLACMFSFLADGTASQPWLIDPSATIRIEALQEAIATGAPLLLFSTALALRHLFEQFPGPHPLPPGSWVLQTGGYKGLEITYDPATLYAAIEECLAVPPERVINEYGMTELSSPSYAVSLDAPHQTPPWLRVRTVDPETNLANPSGEPGHLVFVDLANLNSVLAVRTSDLGVALDEHRFVLQGRDPHAAPRGCSRAADAYLQNP